MDWHSVQVPAALIAGIVALITAVVTALVTFRVAASRADVDRELAHLKKQFDEGLAEQKERLENKVLYAAEDVAYALMRDSKWRLRSWDMIKLHLGGFSDDELRKVLVRAGAIRFEAKSGSELWGLLERNRDLLGVVPVPWDPENPRSLPRWANL